MYRLEDRFGRLIEWAASKGPDGQLAADALQSLWQDIETSLEPDDLNSEPHLVFPRAETVEVIE